MLKFIITVFVVALLSVPTFAKANDSDLCSNPSSQHCIHGAGTAAIRPYQADILTITRQAEELAAKQQSSPTHEINWFGLIVSFLLTWIIGLSPALIARCIIFKRPLRRGMALVIVGFFFLFFVTASHAIQVSQGMRPTSHTVWILVAWASYAIMRRQNMARLDVILPGLGKRTATPMLADDKNFRALSGIWLLFCLYAAQTYTEIVSAEGLFLKLFTFGGFAAPVWLVGGWLYLHEGKPIRRRYLAAGTALYFGWFYQYGSVHNEGEGVVLILVSWIFFLILALPRSTVNFVWRVDQTP